jgi:hypothetical protein
MRSDPTTAPGTTANADPSLPSSAKVAKAVDGPREAAQPSSAGRAATPAPGTDDRTHRAAPLASSLVTRVTSSLPITKVAGRSNAERQQAYRDRLAEQRKATGAKAPRRIRPRRKPALLNGGAETRVSSTKPEASSSRPVRHPSKSPRACSDELIEAALAGIGALGFAVRAGASGSTITSWAEAAPDFAAALMRARAASAYPLEIDANKSPDGGPFKPGPAILVFNFHYHAGADVAVVAEETATGEAA